MKVECEGDIECESFGLEDFTSRLSLFTALGREVAVVPACELVLEVPFGFTVTEEDDSVLSSHR